MVERYRIELVNRNLIPYNSELVRKKGESTFVYDREGLFNIFTPEGWVPGSDLKKIAKELFLRGEGKKTVKEKKEAEIYADLVKKPDYRLGRLERAVNSALILSLLGVLFFVSQKITGSVISSLSNSTLNIGILVCIIGAIILYLCKLRYK